MTDKNKNKKIGFTLVELLIVIAIIGILASLILVAFVTVRQKARVTKASADLKQLSVAVYALQIDTGKGPNGCTDIENWDSPETELDSPWAGILYLDNTALLDGGMDTGTQANHVYNGQSTSYYASYHSASNPFGCGWTAGDIAKWKGPYAGNVKDPWGRAYIFDPDYRDYTAGVVKPALISLGPDGLHDEAVSGKYVDDVIYFLGVRNSKRLNMK